MNQNKTHYIIALTSVPQEDAEHIAKAIINEELAACVQILGPVTSLYWWKGKVEKDAEALLFFKTKKSCIEKMKQRIKSIHPYDIPELLFLPVLDGLEGYLQWVDKIIGDKNKK